MNDDQARTAFLVALAEPNERRRDRWAAAKVFSCVVIAAKTRIGTEFDHDRVLLALARSGAEGSTNSTSSVTGAVRTGFFRPTARDWLGQEVVVAEIEDRYGFTAKVLLRGRVHDLERVKHQ